MVPWLGFIGPPTPRTERSSKAVFLLLLNFILYFYLLRPALFLFQLLSPVSHQLANISGLFFDFPVPLSKMLYSKPFGC